MKIHRATETDLSAALRGLSEKLGLRAGMVSEESRRKTIQAFGAPLEPLEIVRKVLADVKNGGDVAVARYVALFDRVTLKPGQFRVPKAEMDAAWKALAPAVRKALERAASNIERFQKHILPKPAAPFTNPEGGRVQVTYRSLKRVAVYVPGGQAAYPSTVLMTAIPARVAGVSEIVMFTPCGADGKLRAETLAAARLAGVTELYRVGGVPAIAAAAYGTETIRRVDKIVGPGNLFVTLAKREVYGQTDLDMLAGPSEVLVIADAKAEPRFIAADLLSQAEHNPAAAVLLTPSEPLARKVVEELSRQLKGLSRAGAARDCLERYGFIGVTKDIAQAVALANQFAPEHLELAVAKPEKLLPRITSAGAVFLGQYAPEPVGDYVAGPSHVLPTGGTARFFSGLSVTDFLRTMSVLKYDRDALRKAAPDVDALARAEGLDAHARSATIRFED